MKAALFYMAFAPMALAQGGILIGRALDDERARPVAGVWVSAHPRPAAKGRPEAVVRGYTGVDGSFALRGLAAGQYVLCAQAPRSEWLNPCEWAPYPMVITVGQTDAVLRNVVVLLRRGYRLPIVVDDPGGHLAVHEGRTRGADLVIGVVAPRRSLVPAEVVNKRARDQDHVLTVPFDMDLRVFAASGFFRLAHDRELPGVALVDLPAKGGGVALRVRKNEAGRRVKIRVTGVGR